MFEYGYIDLAQVLLYGFWIFFFAYLAWQRAEDKRQGYPLDSDRKGVTVQGWPAIPPKRRTKAKHPALAKAAKMERSAVSEAPSASAPGSVQAAPPSPELEAPPTPPTEEDTP